MGWITMYLCYLELPYEGAIIDEYTSDKEKSTRLFYTLKRAMEYCKRKQKNEKSGIWQYTLLRCYE